MSHSLGLPEPDTCWEVLIACRNVERRVPRAGTCLPAPTPFPPPTVPVSRSSSHPFPVALSSPPLHDQVRLL